MTDEPTTDAAEETPAPETTDEHDTGCKCGVDHEAQEREVLATMHEIEAAVGALDPERRNLLQNAVLHKIEALLEGAMEALQTGKVSADPSALLRPLALAQSAVGLAGLVAQVNRTENEDWTRDRDTKVDAVWTMFAEMVRRMAGGSIDGSSGVVITPDDLPEDLLRRVAAGNGTPEDHAAVKKVVAEKAGVDPDEIDVEAMFAAENGQVRPVGEPANASAGPAQPGKPPPFKPRLNEEGQAVDESGHAYGGQYL